MKRLHLTDTTLRLFLVLDALLAEGSVTRAAARLGLTQPAVSHALRHLRELYGDPLVVRTRDGMSPTPLAQALLPRLRAGLTELEKALNGEVGFDPAVSRRRFTLATVDHPAITSLPAMMARLAVEAPGIDVRVRPLGPGLAEQLETGALDTVLAGGEVERQLALDRGLMRTLICSEPFVCIVRADHPRVGETLDVETWLTLPHVMTSTGGHDRGLVDAVLEQHGLSRRIALTVPSFAGAPAAVAGTDMVAAVPRTIAEWGARLYGLRRFPPPLPLPAGDAYLWWHERLHGDAAHRWWRRLLLDAFAAHRD